MSKVFCILYLNKHRLKHTGWTSATSRSLSVAITSRTWWSLAGSPGGWLSGGLILTSNAGASTTTLESSNCLSLSDSMMMLGPSVCLSQVRHLRFINDNY